MINLKNLEIINISKEGDTLVALLSFQNPDVTDLNNGFDTIRVPVNIREIQMSSRGNMLVDQSVKTISQATEKTKAS